MKLSDNYEAMYHGAVNGCIQYLLKYKSIKSLIIGVSGGIDSAVSCMLARAVCNKLKDRKVTLIGRSIAIDSNTAGEIKRAKEVGKHFCNNSIHIDLTEHYKILSNRILPNTALMASSAEAIEVDRKLKVRAGNIKARLRMIYLYDLSAKYNGMVLSNDNLTEYMLGFWTLHGDVGDFGFIQNLWKTEVYGLAEWWISNSKDGIDDKKASALLSCIKAAPTDGLGITDSDLDQLLPGYRMVNGGDHQKGYNRVDNTLITHLASPSTKSYIKKQNSVVERHLKTQFKRENPFSVERNLLIP